MKTRRERLLVDHCQWNQFNIHPIVRHSLTYLALQANRKKEKEIAGHPPVFPAQAGIQPMWVRPDEELDPRLRGDDGKFKWG